MTDDPYGDEQLVTLYDLDNRPGADHAYYRDLADQVGARTIIDLGCGTGVLTRALARPGRTVIGIDPSPTMLGYARTQPAAETVTWIDGDASAVEPTADVDLVVCTGNAIMHVSPQEFPGVLRSLAAALRPGGTISFETRNPAAREWERWTREATYGERDTSFGHLREWLEVTDTANGRVVFDAHNVFADGRDAVYTSILYFHTPAQLTAGLRAAGFTAVDIRGGWQGEPVTDSSAELVVRAVRGSAGSGLS